MKQLMEKFRRYQRFVEASYEGNLGMEEVMRFYMDAPPEKVTEFEQAVDADENDKAWDIVQDYLGVDLVGLGTNQGDMK